MTQVEGQGAAAGDVLRRTPLFDDQVAAGATFAPFAGWSMPLSYSGTVVEHRAVRSSAGVFDVSHMGQVRLHGPQVGADLRRLLAGRFDRIDDPGTAVYALLVDERGGIHDDVIAYRLLGEEVLVVCNAANRELVVSTLRAGCSPRTEVEDVSDAWAMLALQGPAALDVLESLGARQHEAHAFTWVDASILGHGCMVAMTGYTGERGCELLVPPEAAHWIWAALVADQRVEPCGLGARDTLRLEACFPLHGADIDADHDVVTSSLGWAVDWEERSCVAFEALQAIREAGPARRLVPLLATGRGVPRPGCAVLDVHAETVGEVTSGTMGPSVGAGIALARVDAALAAVGTELAIDVRGRAVPARVVQRPFVRGG